MSQPNTTPSGLPAGYPELLADLKSRIRSAQVRAALSVNRELVLLYWQIGRSILHRQGEEGWGAKVIDRLSVDLRREFPEMKGFSPRNLKYMRAFAEAYSDETVVQEALAQITWYHNITLLSKVKDPAEREWYLCETVKNGWSRNVLVHQIESDLFQRQEKAVTNLHRTLPSPQSDLAQQILKDPYNFDFLSLGDRTRPAPDGVNVHGRAQRPQGRGQGGYVEDPFEENGLTDWSHIFDQVIGRVDVYGCGL